MGPKPPSAVLSLTCDYFCPASETEIYIWMWYELNTIALVWAYKMLFKRSLFARENISPPPPNILHQTSSELAPRSCNEDDAFWQDRIPMWGFSLFIGNMSVLICPGTTHRSCSREDVDSQQVLIFLHPSSVPIQPCPIAWYGSSTARRRSGQDAWWRSPGFLSSPSQALVGW